VEINTRDKDKWSPLISAAKWGNLEIVEKLVAHGAKQKQDDNEVVDMVTIFS